ncbi:hypothetical protein [[Mycoplasma] testudinis]|uniref:hypothetical protein n=1 Tax=[Mycoplasma] testudinis TaxID=33924 RepID=UPI00047FE056|nr:hypothetical protein [[Mycoplasma] testudinis]
MSHIFNSSLIDKKQDEDLSELMSSSKSSWDEILENDQDQDQDQKQSPSSTGPFVSSLNKPNEDSNSQNNLSNNVADNLKIVFEYEKNNDYEKISGFKIKWFYFIPIVGLVIAIFKINKVFKNLSLGLSRKCFTSNGTFLISVIGIILLALMAATLASFMVATYYLVLFNSLNTFSDVIVFVGYVVLIAVLWFLIINYFLVFFFFFYVLRKTKKNYFGFIAKTIIDLDWNNYDKVMETIRNDRFE